MTTHLSPEPQPSDIGFGYMSQGDMLKHTSIEVPLTPRSPMKSALKPPGTPGRFIDPRSPTFKEEVKLEEEESKTEKQNAADIVGCQKRLAQYLLIHVVESQDPSPHGQVLPPWGELQLQSYCPLHAFNHVSDIQRNEATASTK